MRSFRHILAVLDPTSQRQPALERAAWLARQTGASLELFICDYDAGLAGEGQFDPASLEKARTALVGRRLRTLHEHAKELVRTGLDVTVDARWDHPLYAGIARKVAGGSWDLVVKDTHYHALLERSVFSNTDWELIRCCPAPLWLVKPHAFPTPRIVAAIDPLHARDKPASLDRQILAAAEAVANAVAANLHVFHAYDVAPALALSVDSMTMPISAAISDLADSLRRRHTAAVFAVSDACGLERKNVHICEGDARQLLVTVAKQLEASLVVIGAVSRSGLRRLFLGSTAEQVLDKLPCDVLIIKPADLKLDSPNEGVAAPKITRRRQAQNM